MEKKALADLPPPVTTASPLYFIMTRINQFCKALRGSMIETSDKPFIHKNQARYARFKEEIVRTRPQLNTTGSEAVLPIQNLSWSNRPGLVSMYDVTKAIER